MVERSLSMREVPGSIPGSSTSFSYQEIWFSNFFSCITQFCIIVRMAERSKALRSGRSLVLQAWVRIPLLTNQLLIVTDIDIPRADPRLILC